MLSLFHPEKTLFEHGATRMVTYHILDVSYLCSSGMSLKCSKSASSMGW